MGHGILLSIARGQNPCRGSTCPTAIIPPPKWDRQIIEFGRLKGGNQMEDIVKIGRGARIVFEKAEKWG
jgi:hypothetical protein